MHARTSPMAHRGTGAWSHLILKAPTPLLGHQHATARHRYTTVKSKDLHKTLPARLSDATKGLRHAQGTLLLAPNSLLMSDVDH
jgi:hypothetical protein